MGLVGMCFLRFENEGAGKGRVVARVGAEYYLITMESWGRQGVDWDIVLPVGALVSPGFMEGFMFFATVEDRDRWWAEAEMEGVIEPEEEERVRH